MANLARQVAQENDSSSANKTPAKEQLSSVRETDGESCGTSFKQMGRAQESLRSRSPSVIEVRDDSPSFYENISLSQDTT